MALSGIAMQLADDDYSDHGYFGSLVVHNVILMYSPDSRWHNKTLLAKTVNLNDRDFHIRMQCKDCWYFNFLFTRCQFV